MLRSKQLLPFAKGARAWIVAGSVPKPNTLDGTGNGAEDGKAEQGHVGTKTANPHVHSHRAEDSPFRRSAIPAGGYSSGGAEFGRIHESSKGLLGHAPKPVVPAVTIPSKEVSVILPTAAGEHLSIESSSPSLSAVAPVAESPKSNVTRPKNKFSSEKTREVGLATVSHLSGKEASAKNGQVSNGRAPDAASRSVLPAARSGRSLTSDVQNAAPVRKSVPDKKTGESRAIAVSSISGSGAKLPHGGSTAIGNNGRKALSSLELEEDDRVSTATISDGTVNVTIGVPKHAKNLEGQAPLAEKNAIKSSRQDTAKYNQSNSRGVWPEVNGSSSGDRDVVIQKTYGWLKSKEVQPVVSNSQRKVNGSISGDGDVVIQKTYGWSKSKEVPTVVSNSQRKGNGRSQVVGNRQSHGSARNSGREAKAQEIIDHVGGVLKRMGWTSQTVDALASVNSSLNAFHVNEVLKHQREAGLAWEFFNWAKRQSGYKHDVRTYTTMIGILGRVRNFEACDRLMIDMHKEGFEPSVVTFNRLIHSYGRANHLEEALQIFHHMQKVGCEPDRVTYCTLIDLHSKAGLHDIAMEICQQMWQAGFEADTFSYSLIIHCLGKAGNLPAAYQLFQEMLSKGCKPNLVTYNIMIDLHAKAGNHPMALKLYNDMQDAGYHPDNVTYSIIMEVLGHSGHMDEAENVFVEMEQAGWAADATAFGSMVYMWGQAGNVEKATEWHKRMLDSGLAPNVPTCNSLLWAYMRVKDYESAQQVLASMPRCGLYPTLPTYILLLSNCTTCENQEDVDATLQIMSRTGHPAHSFLRRLLHEKDSRESMADIYQFFDSLLQEEQNIKRSFADAMIEFLYKLDHKDRAGNVWEVAVERNFYPSAVCQRAPNFWVVDLHVMSIGTAVVALLRTLASLRERMLVTGDLPDRIEIVTGWGRHSRVSGLSKNRNVVSNILEALHAPFYVDNSNVGCFIGSGQPLVDWLHQPEMDHMLAL